jgi:hypothetical protein
MIRRLGAGRTKIHKSENLVRIADGIVVLAGENAKLAPKARMNNIEKSHERD